MEKPLIEGRFLLKTMPEKGGWTYTELPLPEQDGPGEKRPFGWWVVRGTIDSFEIKQVKLWPTKGQLFMSFRAEIRKAIRKKGGDWVDIRLWHDDSEVEIPDELLACLLDSPPAHAFFETLTHSNKKYYVDWIYSAKRVETRVDRIAQTIERLEQGLKMYDGREPFKK